MEKRKGKRVPTAVKLVIAVALVVSIVITAFGGWSSIYQLVGLKNNLHDENSLTAEFFSVGCADCCIISSGGRHILIDAGENSEKNSALHYIRQNGVDKIDLAVITHFDSDHCNNFLSILNEIRVDRLVTSFAFEGSEDSADIITAATKGGTAVEYMSAGGKIEVGNMSVSALSPKALYSTDNDNSLVIKLEAFGKSMLFMADCGSKAEQDILQYGDSLKCDILKVSHHGSGTATGKEFLSLAQPKYAVISVGMNKYALPSIEVISRLEAVGAQVFRTDKAGTISFKITQEEISVKTDN